MLGVTKHVYLWHAQWFLWHHEQLVVVCAMIPLLLVDGSGQLQHLLRVLPRRSSVH